MWNHVSWRKREHHYFPGSVLSYQLSQVRVSTILLLYTYKYFVGDFYKGLYLFNFVRKKKKAEVIFCATGGGLKAFTSM